MLRLSFIFALCVLVQAPSYAQKIVIFGTRDRSVGNLETAEISGSRLEVRGDEGSLERALARSPSVHILPGSDPATAPRFLVRGQDSIENRYFLDGYPLSNARLNQPDLEMLSTAFFQDLELYPGGVPIQFAEDGLGGAINFRLPTLGSSSSFSARTGAFGFVSATADVASGTRTRVGIEYTQAEEDFLYFDDNGTPLNTSDDRYRTREHNRMRRFAFVPRVRLIDTKTHEVELLSWHSGLVRQLPGPTRAGGGGDIKEYLQLTGLRSRWTPNADLALESRVHLRLNKESLSDIAPILGSSPQSFDAGHTALGVRSQLRYWPWRTDIVVGAVWEKYTIRSLNSGVQGEQQRIQIPLSAALRIPVASKLELQPIVQSHLYGYTSRGQATFGTTGTTPVGLTSDYVLVSPRLGAVWRLNRSLQWRTLVGHFYRAPSLFELFGSPTGVSAAPNLRYESAFKVETGVDWSETFPGPVESFQIGYTVAYQRAADLITYIQNSQNSSVATNIGASRLLTHEVQAALATTWGIGFNANAVWMDSVNFSTVSYETGKELPLRPAFRAQAGITYSIAGLKFGYNFAWAGESFGDTANLKRLAGVMYHNAYISWDTKDFGTFLLEGRNLSDATTAASRYQNTDIETIDYTTGYPGYPAPGRRVYLSWSHTL